MTRDALVVGINGYSNFDPLKTPAGDAEAIAQLLQQYGEFNVVKRLPECIGDDKKHQVDPNPQGKEAQVTVEKLQQALEQLFDQKIENTPDTALFFFAGHGWGDKNQASYYGGFLATSETNPKKGNPGLSLQWLQKLLKDSHVGEQIVWLDCCYSGEFSNFKEANKEVNPEDWNGRARCFIAASPNVAYEDDDGKHGKLSSALLDGLNPTRRTDGHVNSYDLVSFISKKTGWPQRPVCYVSPNKPITLTRSVWNPNTLSTGKKFISDLSVQETELEIKEFFDNPSYHSTIIKIPADHPLVQKLIDDPIIGANIKLVLNSSEDYNRLSVFVTPDKLTPQIQNEKYDDKNVRFLKVANDEKLSVDDPEKMDEVLNLLNNQSPQESTKNYRSESFLNLVAANDGELLSKMKKEKIEKENILDESELISSRTLWKKLISKIYLLMGKGSNQTTNYEFAIKRGYYIWPKKSSPENPTSNNLLNSNPNDNSDSKP